MRLLARGTSLFLLMVGWLTSSCQQNGVFSTTQLDLQTETISTEFKNPWSFTILPDGRMLVTEKEGELFILENGVKSEPVAGLPEIFVRGQGGLMDLELHPSYEENGWIYISYGSSSDGRQGNTTVMRAKLEGNTLTDQEVIFKAEPDSRKGQHWGGRMEFDNEGYLYISVGDRGARDENPQSLENHSGKIHRVHDDGSVPSDNPFVHVEGAVASIYSYGHRNPQGMALNPGSGEIWTHEHGPRGGDELNVIRAGNNYGWPVITYGINYNGTEITPLTDKEGMQQPVTYWVPSIAPCGMTFITGDIYPEWEGSIILGSLKYQYLHRCEMLGNKVIMQEKVLDGFGRMRTVRQGPDGYLYCSIEGKGIFKIIPVRS